MASEGFAPTLVWGPFTTAAQRTAKRDADVTQQLRVAPAACSELPARVTVTSRVCQEDGGSFSVAGSESSPVGPGIKLRKVHRGFKSTYLGLSSAHRKVTVRLCWEGGVSPGGQAGFSLRDGEFQHRHLERRKEDQRRHARAVRGQGCGGRVRLLPSPGSGPSHRCGGGAAGVSGGRVIAGGQRSGRHRRWP